MPRLSDRFGRKLVVQIGAIVASLFYTVLLLTSNQMVLMGVILGYGMVMPLQFTIGFIYLLELMPAS